MASQSSGRRSSSGIQVCTSLSAYLHTAEVRTPADKTKNFVELLTETSKKLEGFLDTVGKATDEEKEIKSQKKLIQKIMKELAEIK